MNDLDDNSVAAKHLFKMVNGKIAALRAEMELLEAEGNGLRGIAESIAGKLSSTPALVELATATDANVVVNQKWSEQAQRYSSQAGTVAKILLDKSKQMLDLVQLLKVSLRDLGYNIPDDNSIYHDWDEILFESDGSASE